MYDFINADTSCLLISSCSIADNDFGPAVGKLFADMLKENTTLVSVKYVSIQRFNRMR